MPSGINQIVIYTVIYALAATNSCKIDWCGIQSAECWQIRYDAALIEWQT